MMSEPTFSKMRSLDAADMRDKRALVRVDFNVPLHDGVVTDDSRIHAALPTLAALREGGASVILATHLGRPKGQREPRFSVGPVARRLGELLGVEVRTVSDIAGPEAQQAAAELHPGDVLLLENTRFEPGEEANDPELAAAMARLGDLYVNDAFGAAHRAHASTVGVAKHLPSYAGLLLQREVTVLSRLLVEPSRPFVAILGGAKVSDKLAVVSQLLDRVDALLLGGGMANTLMLAQNFEVGASLAEPDRVPDARELIALAALRGVRLLLPIDAVVAPSLSEASRIVPVAAIAANQAILDIGPETARTYCDEIAGAKTVFWNGPMGVFEREPFAAGTLRIARCVAEAEAFTVVGGGDSIAAVSAAGVADRIDHISTGGGASLEFLEGRALPGIAALLDR